MNETLKRDDDNIRVKGYLADTQRFTPPRIGHVRRGIVRLLLIATVAFALCDCGSDVAPENDDSITKASAFSGELRALIANSEWDLIAAVQSEAGKDVSADLAMDGDWVRFTDDTVCFYRENIIYDSDTGESTLQSEIIGKYNFEIINNQSLVIGGKSFSLISDNDGMLRMECAGGWSLVLAPRNGSRTMTGTKN